MSSKFSPSPSTVYLTDPQLTARWGLHPVTLAQWRVERKGPAYIKVGRSVRYPMEEVLRYESENSHGLDHA